MQLDDILEGFWLSRRRNLSKNTVADYERTFTRLREFLGNAEFGAITPRDLDQFLDYVKEKYALGEKTLLNHWTALSALWTWAEQAVGVTQIVRNRVERPRPSRRQSNPYTEAEVRSLLDACENMNAWSTKHGKYVTARRPTAKRDKAIILVLLDSGIRASELCDLRMQDYDKKRGQMTVHHGKGDKKRVLYLGDTARQAVWRYLTTRLKVMPDDPLFASREGRKLDRSNVLHLIERAGERAGVPNAGLHRFRHTFAINYLRNGGNVLALQQMLGHERLETVRIYARLASVDLERTQRQASPADNWRL